MPIVLYPLLTVCLDFSCNTNIFSLPSRQNKLTESSHLSEPQRTTRRRRLAIADRHAKRERDLVAPPLPLPTPPNFPPILRDATGPAWLESQSLFFFCFLDAFFFRILWLLGTQSERTERGAYFYLGCPVAHPPSPPLPIILAQPWTRPSSRP